MVSSSYAQVQETSPTQTATVSPTCSCLPWQHIHAEVVTINFLQFRFNVKRLKLEPTLLCTFERPADNVSKADSQICFYLRTKTRRNCVLQHVRSLSVGHEGHDNELRCPVPASSMLIDVHFCHQDKNQTSVNLRLTNSTS